MIETDDNHVHTVTLQRIKLHPGLTATTPVFLIERCDDPLTLVINEPCAECHNTFLDDLTTRPTVVRYPDPEGIALVCDEHIAIINYDGNTSICHQLGYDTKTCWYVNDNIRNAACPCKGHPLVACTAHVTNTQGETTYPFTHSVFNTTLPVDKVDTVLFDTTVSSLNLSVSGEALFLRSSATSPVSLTVEGVGNVVGFAVDSPFMSNSTLASPGNLFYTRPVDNTSDTCLGLSCL